MGDQRNVKQQRIPPIPGIDYFPPVEKLRKNRPYIDENIHYKSCKYSSEYSIREYVYKYDSKGWSAYCRSKRREH